MRHWIICSAALLIGVASAATEARADDWRLSTAGYGPARIGMTLDEAAHALAVELVIDALDDDLECYYARPNPPIAGLSLMMSQGRVVRFDINAPGILSRSGLGIGDAEARVLEALGRQSVEVTAHKYVAPDGNYLTVWSNDRRAALRFETFDGKVTSFHAGRVPEVTYVEGCS